MPKPFDGFAVPADRFDPGVDVEVGRAVGDGCRADVVAGDPTGDDVAAVGGVTVGEVAVVELAHAVNPSGTTVTRITAN